MQSEAILILDQEEAIRDSLQFILSDEGYLCFTAWNKKEALEKLANHHISVVVLDSELAVKTNILKKISSLYPEVRSVVISSYAGLEADRLSLMSDADEFILKPLNFDELINQIKKLLSISAL